MRNIQVSERLFSRATQLMPGGVNSPVRAFKAVGGVPPFIERASGAYLYDADGNRYIDYINSWGPMILGHAHPVAVASVQQAALNGLSYGAPTRKELEIVELIVAMVPAIEQVRMVNSGTEATMSAVRLARGYTGREKIIKMAGCYHGHADSFLIAAGSGVATLGIPDSPGVTASTARDTLIAPFNNLEVVAELIAIYPGQIAAIILEPVAGNMGCVLPKAGYLSGLRTLCDKNDILLIFDEVMTGFRLAKGGAQALFGVMPDITTLGKIIGGGMPVGAYGGKKEIMAYVAPSGPVYQAGTLSGNPIAMAAGYSTLKTLNDSPNIYENLAAKTAKLHRGITNNLTRLGLHYTINHIGSMLSLFFTSQPINDFEDAKKADMRQFKKYFHAMLERGIYLAPSPYESLFISTALSDADLETTISANFEALKLCYGQLRNS